MNSQLSKFIYSPTDALVSGLKKPILKFTAPTCFGAVTPSSRSVLMRILYRILYLPLYFVSLRMAPSEPKHVRDNTTYFIMNVFSCILLTNSKIIHGQGKILNLGYVPSITAIFAMWRLVIHFSKQNIVGLCIWSFLLATAGTYTESHDWLQPWLYLGSHYGLCSYSAVTSGSHGNQAAEYTLMDFAPLVTCRGNIAFFKTNMK